MSGSTCDSSDEEEDFLSFEQLCEKRSKGASRDDLAKIIE